MSDVTGIIPDQPEESDDSTPWVAGVDDPEAFARWVEALGTESPGRSYITSGSGGQRLVFDARLLPGGDPDSGGWSR